MSKKERSPAADDFVTHDGCWPPDGNTEPIAGKGGTRIVPGPFRITGFKKRPALDESGERAVVRHFTVFENAQFSVECETRELVWLDEDQAWMLPGRLLSRAQRKVWRDVLGVKQGPPAEKHVEARAFLQMMLAPEELRARTTAAQVEIDARKEGKNG